MNESTKAKVIAILRVLAEQFPAFREKATPALVEVWARTLEPYSTQALIAAAGRLADGRVKVMPCLGDVVNAIEGEWVKVPIARTDAFGGVYAQDTIGWQWIRVPRGERVPTYLDEMQAKRLGMPAREDDEAPPQLAGRSA